ncbi:MAG: CDP-alcohol phosphatidyltransferase family protein [Oscillospiraceae bacterium]|jgi:CDP-diacylglycerol--glycerol-3-phosphate 3-phosphatidyltransferase|nr:CDP-alcohol phosphatidyltransferase family protein [Oscillospiraceae bacterium]
MDMMKKFTIPNLLSIFRLLLVPVFAVTYFDGGEYSGLRAVLIYILAGLTDILDGYIARKYKMMSALGRVLDPLGDKLMAFTVLVCITVDETIPPWAVITFFVKEVLMGIGALVLFRKIADTPPSNVFGKTSTVVFFAVCVILIVGKGHIKPPIPSIMITGAIVIMLLAFASYVSKFISIQQKTKGSVQREEDGEAR